MTDFNKSLKLQEFLTFQNQTAELYAELRPDFLWTNGSGRCCGCVCHIKIHPVSVSWMWAPQCQKMLQATKTSRHQKALINHPTFIIPRFIDAPSLVSCPSPILYIPSFIHSFLHSIHHRGSCTFASNFNCPLDLLVIKTLYISLRCLSISLSSISAAAARGPGWSGGISSSTASS